MITNSKFFIIINLINFKDECENKNRLDTFQFEKLVSKYSSDIYQTCSSPESDNEKITKSENYKDIDSQNSTKTKLSSNLDDKNTETSKKFSTLSLDKKSTESYKMKSPIIVKKKPKRKNVQSDRSFMDGTINFCNHKFVSMSTIQNLENKSKNSHQKKKRSIYYCRKDNFQNILLNVSRKREL